MNECLILKKEEYPGRAFKQRKDFRAVFAAKLKHVAKDMFYGAHNLVTAIMPEAEVVVSGAFTKTSLQNCFFPRVLRIGDFGFQRS